MDAVTHETYKDRLLELQERLANEVRGTGERTRHDPQEQGESLHVTPRAPRGERQGLGAEIPMGNAQTEMLDLVDAALRRIDAGDFGRCVDCGREISPTQLNVTPYAPYCANCEERREHQPT